MAGSVQGLPREPFDFHAVMSFTREAENAVGPDTPIDLHR